MSEVILIGKKIFKWEVLQEDPETLYFPASYKRYICKCSCGLLKSISRQQLLYGKVRTCKKCCYKERIKYNFEPGTKFNDWTIMSEEVATRTRRFLCRCSCGALQGLGLVAIVYGQSKRCKKCTLRNRVKAKIIKLQEYLKSLE